MSIPQSQLETWSNPGALATSADAYQRVRNVLLAAGSPVANGNADIYLQGSYANSTNIYGDLRHGRVLLEAIVLVLGVRFERRPVLAHPREQLVNRQDAPPHAADRN
jgi:hypothetical protein